jgi:hypothetical protein
MAFTPAPTIAAVTSTGSGKGVGIMTSTAKNNIGTPPQNSPFTNQPNWTVSPINSGSNDGTDVYSTG